MRRAESSVFLRVVITLLFWPNVSTRICAGCWQNKRDRLLIAKDTRTFLVANGLREVVCFHFNGNSLIAGLQALYPEAIHGVGFRRQLLERLEHESILIRFVLGF